MLLYTALLTLLNQIAETHPQQQQQIFELLVQCLEP